MKINVEQMQVRCRPRERSSQGDGQSSPLVDHLSVDRRRTFGRRARRVPRRAGFDGIAASCDPSPRRSGQRAGTARPSGIRSAARRRANSSRCFIARSARRRADCRQKPVTPVAARIDLHQGGSVCRRSIYQDGIVSSSMFSLCKKSSLPAFGALLLAIVGFRRAPSSAAEEIFTVTPIGGRPTRRRYSRPSKAGASCPARSRIGGTVAAIAVQGGRSGRARPGRRHGR